MGSELLFLALLTRDLAELEILEAQRESNGFFYLEAETNTGQFENPLVAEEWNTREV